MTSSVVNSIPRHLRGSRGSRGGKRPLLRDWAYTRRAKINGKEYVYSNVPGFPRIRLPNDPKKARRVVVKMLRARDPMTTFLSDMLTASRSRAKKKGWVHTVSLRTLQQMMVRQRGMCLISGIAFDLDGTTSDQFARPFAPSLDRIDCSNGYTPTNCRLVCRAINFAMGKWGEGIFARVALAVAAHSAISGAATTASDICKTEKNVCKTPGERPA